MSIPFISDAILTWSHALQLLFAVLPIGLLAKWNVYRERRWRFSSRRTQSLRRLLKKDAWRDAPALELEYAFQDAFGRSLTRTDMAFIETRERPLILIQDRLTAGSAVRLDDEGTGFERVGRPWAATLPLGAWSFIWSSLAWLCVAITLFVGAYAVEKQVFVLFLCATDFLVLACALFFASRMLDAAARVISLRSHPKARALAPKSKARDASSKRRTKTPSDEGSQGAGLSAVPAPSVPLDAPSNPTQDGGPARYG